MTFKALKTIGLILALAFVIVPCVLGQINHTNGNARSAVLKVNAAVSAWSETDMADRLMAELSRNGNGEIIRAEALSATMPPFPSDIYSTDSLANWGMESGKHYLVIVNIESEGLQKQRTFNIPLIASKYENVGVVIGELRIFDVTRRRVLLSEQYTFEKEARGIFQAAPDDNINDADLHVSAPEKIRFFRELETELAKELAKKIRSVTSLR